MTENALTLPNSTAAFVDQSGRLTTAGRASLNEVIRRLQGQITDIESVLNSIIALEEGQTDIAGALALKADKAQVVTGSGSISGGGTLAVPVILSLEGDQEAPGANVVYGTDEDGNKGWMALGLVSVGNAETLDGEGPAYYLSRTNHTGEQAISTVTGLQTALNGKQPLDGTLTALAGANWAANALPIGSGADTVAQVSFAANTFPARASTGSLVAKSITDFALTILDDADAATVRATIGAEDAGAAAAALAAANDYTDDELVAFPTVSHTWTVQQTFSADIIVTGASWRMVQGTADGTDTGRWVAAGGGAPSAARGAYFAAHGNENATFPGQAQIVAGAGADIVITASSGGIVRPSVDNAAALGSASFRYAGFHSIGLNNYGAEYSAGNQSPAQFTADQTDFALLDTTAWLRVSTNASRALNSMTGGASGRRVLITNVGATNNLTIPNEGAGTAANRFLTPAAGTVTVGPGASAWAQYDAASLRWRIVAA